MHGELPVYKASYDLLLGIFALTGQFKREFKYTVGERLRNETLDLLGLIQRANGRKDRREVLLEAREKVEVIRLFLRLMKDLHQLSLKTFVNINRQVESVSKQLAGWEKASRKTSANMNEH